MLVDGEASQFIQRKAVRTGLAVLADVEPTVAALGHEDGELTILRPPIDHVVIGVAEEKVSVSLVGARNPNGTFGEKETASQFFDLCSWREDFIERRVFADDLSRRFTESNARRAIKVQGRRLY